VTVGTKATEQNGVMSMLRRTFLVAAASAIAWPSVGYCATSIRIWGLWARDPTPNRNGVNQLKGTLYFRVNSDRADRSLNTYGNGSAATSPERQCVELIKRYAAKLGFPGYAANLGSTDNGNSLPSLGDGYQVARRFATASDGGFAFVANGATALPKAGAVISIEEWIPGGHVGIICNHDAQEAQAGEIRIKIFEQNMPIDTWKEIRFTRRSGLWSGAMLNNGVYRNVIGWANPTG
jgi:hypothetical protein